MRWPGRENKVKKEGLVLSSNKLQHLVAGEGKLAKRLNKSSQRARRKTLRMGTGTRGTEAKRKGCSEVEGGSSGGGRVNAVEHQIRQKLGTVCWILQMIVTGNCDSFVRAVLLE